MFFNKKRRIRELENDIANLKRDLKRSNNELECCIRRNDMLENMVKSNDISSEDLRRTINNQICRIGDLDNNNRILSKKNTILTAIIERIYKDSVVF